MQEKTMITLFFYLENNVIMAGRKKNSTKSVFFNEKSWLGYKLIKDS